MSSPLIFPRCVFCFAIVIGTGCALAADHWPELRGPQGNGHSSAVNLPLQWSDTENVVWKTQIHDRGWSSPVIWNDQIWLTTATVDGHQMFAVAIDRQSGKVIHDVKVFDTPQPEPVALMNSYASPTPTVEAGRVYVHYGTYGTACLDTNTGAILWTRRDLRCDHHEGPGSSPILFQDLLLVHVDGRDVQYVTALNKFTGETVWKTDRSVDYGPFPGNLRKAFCTPIVIQVDGVPQMISPGAKAIMAYDPFTGRELWKVRYDGWSVTPRPLFGHGLVIFVNDYEQPRLMAIRPNGHGDVTDTHVAWEITRSVPSRPSPLLIDDLVFTISSDGVATCLESATGETVWRHRVGGNFSASPLFADGRIYLFDEDSVTTVLEPAREFTLLAVNRLADEQLMASPAAVDGSLFIRTATSLYRIESRR